MQCRAWVWLMVLLWAAAVTARGATLELRGCADLPENIVRGLSGITRVGDSNIYWGAMDNSDRLVKLQIDLAGDASIRSARVVAEMRLPAKKDYEGIAYRAGRDSVLVSDESPAITEISLPEGREIRRLDIPAVFKNIVPNQGFESLSLSPDGKMLWTANERALSVDGNTQLMANPILSTTRVRLVRFDVDGDSIKPSAQFLYRTSGVHDWGGQIGLCDLAALADGRLLALERSAAMNFHQVGSIRTRIFLIDVSRGATDISGEKFAAGIKDDRAAGTAAVVPVAKMLLFDDCVCEPRGQNLEGLCLGPSLGKDRWAVVGVVDNTDGVLHISHSRVLSFELDLNEAKETARTHPSTGKAR
jgi:hypothetical protein